MADEYDDLYMVQCCIWNVARGLLEADPILKVPVFGGPSHAGADFCCDSLWVWMGESTEYLQVVDDPCSAPMDHEFKLTLAIPACSEGRLAEPGACQPIEEPCAPNLETGCPEPDHKVGEECSGEDRPTAAQESAYVWRARSLLTKELACKIMCCLKPVGMEDACVDLPCSEVRLVSVFQVTEGACAYLEFTLRARW